MVGATSPIYYPPRPTLEQRPATEAHNGGIPSLLLFSPKSQASLGNRQHSELSTFPSGQKLVHRPASGIACVLRSLPCAQRFGAIDKGLVLCRVQSIVCTSGEFECRCNLTHAIFAGVPPQPTLPTVTASREAAPVVKPKLDNKPPALGTGPPGAKQGLAVIDLTEQSPSRESSPVLLAARWVFRVSGTGLCPLSARSVFTCNSKLFAYLYESNFLITVHCYWVNIRSCIAGSQTRLIPVRATGRQVGQAMGPNSSA